MGKERQVWGAASRGAQLSTPPVPTPDFTPKHFLTTQRPQWVARPGSYRCVGPDTDQLFLFGILLRTLDTTSLSWFSLLPDGAFRWACLTRRPRSPSKHPQQQPGAWLTSPPKFRALRTQRQCLLWFQGIACPQSYKVSWTFRLAPPPAPAHRRAASRHKEPNSCPLQRFLSAPRRQPARKWAKPAPEGQSAPQREGVWGFAVGHYFYLHESAALSCFCQRSQWANTMTHSISDFMDKYFKGILRHGRRAGKHTRFIKDRPPDGRTAF